LKWLPDNVHSSRSLGDQKTNAQVHPGLLTKFLADQVLSKPNTSLIIGRATSLATSSSSSQARHTVKVEVKDGLEKDIPADTVVLAAGPWTGQLAKDLLGEKIGGRLGVEGHRAHSVVIRTKEALTAHCLFTSMTMADGSMGEPEVYARPDGELSRLCFSEPTES
jgi:glycine/D-amino acid oxidase-like deaminating enzyme